MRRMCSLVVFLFVLACSFPLRGQTSSQTINPSKLHEDLELRTLLKQLVAELTSLRIELRLQRLDRLQATISDLETEIRQVQSDRVKLEEQEGSQSSEVAELDERLQQANLDPGERASLETAKAKIMITVPEKLRAEKAIVLSREQELQGRLLKLQRLRQTLLSETNNEGR
jgi:predicted nuclease with TOPRIM domain